VKTSIEICGEINQSTLAYVFAALEDPSDEIDIFVDSDGGDISPALDIYVRLLAHPARKVAYIRNASSAALFPALAADRRIAQPGARILLHRCAYTPPASKRWTAQRHADVAAQLQSHDGEMVSVLSYRTGVPAAVFRAEMENETDAPLDWCLSTNIITGLKND
jgi:ATP-dependent protease ClpP protease subunit